MATYYEILKNYEHYGWCLEKIHYNEEMARAEMAKMKEANPNDEYKVVSNDNAWYDDKNWIG